VDVQALQSALEVHNGRQKKEVPSPVQTVPGEQSLGTEHE
jgi:hypothetical protein